MGNGDKTWGVYTSEFPTMDTPYIFNSAEYTHNGVRDLTPDL